MLNNRSHLVASAILAAFAMLSGMNGIASAEVVIDSINSSATPQAGLLYQTAVDVGWFYRPSLSYDLIGIDTRFGATVDSRTVTVEIYEGNVPSSGGTLLRSADFSPLANLFTGGRFAPIHLTAGQTYFVGFRNVSGLSANVTNEAGSIVVSNLRFDITGVGTYNLSSTPGDADRPILRFIGPTAAPEPASVVMLGTSALGLLAGTPRRRRGQRADT